MEKNDNVCLISILFIKEIQKAFNVKFSMDETIFITSILVLDFDQIPKKKLCRNAAGDSWRCDCLTMIDSIRHFIQRNNVDALNMSWSDDIEKTKEILKQKIVSCHNDKGVFVIYDIGKILLMLNSIKEET